MRSSKRVKLDERYDESPSSSRSSSRSGERMMPVGTDYNIGSDPALWPPQGPMQGMAGGSGAPYPMNPGTPYNQGSLDVSGYPGNQPQRTPMMVPPSPSTQQLDAFLSGISSPGRPPSSVPPPPSVPGIPPSPANSIKAGIDYSQAQKPDGDLFGSKEHLMGMASSSTPGKQQSLKVTGGGKPSNSFSEKNPDCNACHTHVETRYHCSECEDFDLCVMCYREKGHKHKMEKFGFGIVEEDNQNEPQMPQNPHEARKQSIEKCIQSLVHACQCRDMTCKIESCIKMKRVIRHTRDCRLRNNGDCTICKQFVALCLFHASNCNENQCSVPLCSNIKQKLKKQRPNK